MRIALSRRLAIVFGLVVPLAETLRRWHQLGDPSIWPFWLDDWAIGGLLLCGAWKTRKDVAGGRPFLAARWGFACGMAYASFFSQVAALDRPDPSGAPSWVVVMIKGSGLALAIVALVAALEVDGKAGGRGARKAEGA